MTTATPRPSHAAVSTAWNGPWVRAYRATRSPSGSGTGSVNATGTPTGSGTPSASRSRPASSMAAQRSSPATRTRIARRASSSAARCRGASAGSTRPFGHGGRRERPEQPEQVGHALEVAGLAVGREPLQLRLGPQDDGRVEQLA